MVNPAASWRDQSDELYGQRHGGVGGRRMRVAELALMEEIHAGGGHAPTAGTSGETARPVWPAGKSERPIVAAKRLTTVERRGLACVKVTREAKGRKR
jgi:hypothetical protein